MANEKRLIDANALKEQIAKEIHTYWTNGTGGYCLAEDVIPDIDNAHTVDAAPVVHGRWENADDGDGVVCSICGTDFCVLLNETDNFNYCPNCGAKMDGETKFVGICEHCVYREDCDWPKLHPKIKLKECPDFKEGDNK